MTGSAEAGGAGASEGSVLAPERPEGPPSNDERRAAAERRSDWFWSRGFPILTVVLALSVPVLLAVGRNIVLHSTEGAVEQQVTDPRAPGWRAFTEPTPVALVVHRGDSGALVGVTLLSLTGTNGGGIVFIPVDTVASAESGRTLAQVAADGEPALRAALEQVLGFTPSDIVTLDRAGWRDAVAGVAPLTVENPDAVFVPAEDREVQRFARGQLTLAAADVPDYLELRNSGERDLNRLVRHEALWRAWLAALGRGATGEEPSGSGALGRYLAALASGPVDMSTLPVQAAPAATSDGKDRFAPVATQVRALLGRVVPFPVGGPTARLRIRLLDGVGTLHHGLDAAAGLVAGGGQIDQVGNAGSFGVPKTTLAYADDALRSQVEALAAELGTGEVVKAASIDQGTDVVVTLGQDYVEARASGQGGTGG